MPRIIIYLQLFITSILLSFNLNLHAAGMVPETSLLVIDEATRSGTINVKNTDPYPYLLYTNVVDLPDDEGPKVIVTQPVVRVEPGQTQQLRFIMQASTPLKNEHLKRVTFEGIPPQNTDYKNKIGMNIRQDIPMLIRPETLPVVTDAWKTLSWSKKGHSYMVTNPGKYVVRLSSGVVFLPSKTLGEIKKTYILPGETLDIVVKGDVTGDSKIEFFPASRYGVAVPSFTAVLN
ncbi:fimbria/pilus chaperone family protein [Enterobacter sp. D2]|uniref:fimbria/pilus chaperone family protein n=1 Tax=Enterobacter sp. D2 TaxID=3102784 RepID=UPI002ACC25A5|nr:fimbria/pilus chaperone family protein [Enterobacter sp. D2]